VSLLKLYHPPTYPTIYDPPRGEKVPNFSVTSVLDQLERMSSCSTSCVQCEEVCQWDSEESSQHLVIAKVLHAIPVWWGFTIASDRQKLGAFIRRGVRLKFYNHNDPTMAELVDEQDQTLFTAVLHNDDHVLRYILPDRRHHSYCLRPKRQELTLAIRRDSRNFFQRLLFKDM